MGPLKKKEKKKNHCKCWRKKHCKWSFLGVVYEGNGRTQRSCLATVWGSGHCGGLGLVRKHIAITPSLTLFALVEVVLGTQGRDFSELEILG